MKVGMKRPNEVSPQQRRTFQPFTRGVLTLGGQVSRLTDVWSDGPGRKYTIYAQASQTSGHAFCILDISQCWLHDCEACDLKSWAHLCDVFS